MKQRYSRLSAQALGLAAALVSFPTSAFATAGSAAPAAASPAAEVRFFPAGGIRPHEVEARRGLAGLLLQNGALVHRGPGVLDLDSASLEVLAAGRVVATQEYGRADLERAAKKGAGLAASGMIDILAFQFRPDQLLGKDAALAATPRLAAGQALMLNHKYIVFAGQADSLRLRFRGRDGNGGAVEAAGELPILTEKSSVAYRFPLSGRWFVGAGATAHSHHRWVAAEEFALDLVRIGEGLRTSRGDGRRRQDYLAYGAEVLAVADGKVVKVIDGIAETDEVLRQPGEAFAAYNERVGQMQDALMQKGLDGIPGNLVVIDHGNGEFSHYAHLVPGSAKVKVGDAVKQGQPIAQLGTSGNSTEPHLHFQLADGPDPLYSTGIPCRFDNLELPWADWERQPQTGDIVVTR